MGVFTRDELVVSDKLSLDLNVGDIGVSMGEFL